MNLFWLKALLIGGGKYIFGNSPHYLQENPVFSPRSSVIVNLEDVSVLVLHDIVILVVSLPPPLTKIQLSPLKLTFYDFKCPSSPDERCRRAWLSGEEHFYFL